MRDNSENTDLKFKYINKLFVKESALQKDIREQAEARDRLGMQLAGYEGKILQLLIKLSKARKIVEFGTFLGYSTTWMAEALGRGGEIYTFELNADVAEQARGNFAKVDNGCKFEVLTGEASENMTKIADQGPFDLIFIDADKAGYPKYLDWAIENLRPGGLVVGDNTFLFGNVYHDEKPEGESQARWQAMREFNSRLADDSVWQSILLPTAEGMTVAMKL